MTLRRDILTAGSAVAVGGAYGAYNIINQEQGGGGGGGGDRPDPEGWLEILAGETYTIREGDSESHTGVTWQIQGGLSLQQDATVAIGGA